MSITAERKKALIREYGLTDGDTGSSEVQVAILSERIRNLTDHLNDNKKDHHSDGAFWLSSGGGGVCWIM